MQMSSGALVISMSLCLLILSSVASFLGVAIFVKNAYFSVQDAQGNTWKVASIPTASSATSQVPIKLKSGNLLKMQMKDTAGTMTNMPTSGLVFETTSSDPVYPPSTGTDVVVAWSASSTAAKNLVFEKQSTGTYLIRTDETPSLYIGYDSTNDVVSTYSSSTDPNVIQWTITTG